MKIVIRWHNRYNENSHTMTQWSGADVVVSFLGMTESTTWVVEPGIKQVHLHLHLHRLSESSLWIVSLNMCNWHFQIMSAMKDSGSSGKLVCLSAMGVRDSWWIIIIFIITSIDIIINIVIKLVRDWITITEWVNFWGCHHCHIQQIPRITWLLDGAGTRRERPTGFWGHSPPTSSSPSFSRWPSSSKYSSSSPPSSSSSSS